MNNDIPDWAKEELKALYEANNRVWRVARPLTKPIFKKLGWKPTVQQIYDVLNDINKEELVAECGKVKQFKDFYLGYRFCGGQCPCVRKQAAANTVKTNMERYGVPYSLSRPDVREKCGKTMLDRYGVKHSGANPELLAKTRATMLDRYGYDNSGKSERNRKRMSTDNPMSNPETREKAADTNLERYGARSLFNSPEIREKMQKTMMDRYGVTQPAQNPEIFEKIKATNRERYGVDYLQQSAEMRKRSVDTMQERYGVNNSSQLPEVIEQRKKTSQERYGVDHYLQLPEVAASIKKKGNKTNLARYGNEHISHRHLTPEAVAILLDKDAFASYIEHKSISTVANELGISTTTAYSYCAKHGIPNHRSSYERELLADLHQHVDHVETNYRKFKMMNQDGKEIFFELDLYIPSHNIAIEFNGIYWHSDIFKDQYYHQRKHLACRELGIRLIMINEDEWLQRPDIIKAKIANILGKSERGLSARKLTLRSIASIDANVFIDRHHIQGSTGSIIYAVGAYHADELVGVMAFNKQRGTGNIELTRFCSSGKTHAGMFSRMFRYAVNDQRYAEVLSFADLRYSNGHVYEKNGFVLVNTIAPDYRYVIGNSTYHKSGFTKAKIAKKFDIDMTAMSEREAMETLGIPRIYDCGKLKYLWCA